MKTRGNGATRIKLLEAACDEIRAKGYNATTVDDICRRAGVSKGSFFHHFASKDQLGVASVEQFGAMARALFAAAPYSALGDPLERLLGYIDFRIGLIYGDISGFSCLMGTSVQEVYSSHPEIRAACEAGMSEHVGELVRDLDDAKALYAPDACWSAQSVGYYMQAVLQGGFIFAKARQDPQVAIDCLVHLRSHLQSLFRQPLQDAHRRGVN
jgi:TetR/AcrR family transcriptional repressor of nem operon